MIKGVEQIYDRHSYAEEKRHALAALAGLIETIVSPSTDNVKSSLRIADMNDGSVASR